MSGIVVITTSGKTKKDFLNSLHKDTGGAVKLAVLQMVKRKPFVKRIKSFFQKVGWSGIISELYHFLAVKLSRKKKQALALVSVRGSSLGLGTYLPEVIKTESINSDDVYERVREINPDLIVIWGGSILKPRLLELAPIVLNIHFGFAPYYRGVNGIERAILDDDFEHVGVTIHKAIPEVDAGEIVKVVTVDHKNSPEEFFKTLNDTAFSEYLRIAKEAYKNGRIVTVPQDTFLGKNYKLKDWNYGCQDNLAKKILKWQARKL